MTPDDRVADPIFGDPRLAARYVTYEVKGNLLAARPRYVTERWGQDEAARLIASLSSSARAVLRQTILPFSWYPMAIMAEVDRAILEGPMGGDIKQMQTFGSAIARYDLSTLYKMLFRLGTPAFVLRRMNVAYSTYIRGGWMRSETPTAQSGRVTMGPAFPMYLCRYGVSGWISAALELSGAKRVLVREEACAHSGAPECVWSATWE